MELHGILPLLKPKGMTSHDCVAKLRKILKMKKIGHTGTLDPEVTGVLPICLGRATKVAQYMSDYSKTYIGEVTLGFSTTTEDFTGEIVEKKSVDTVITKEMCEAVLQQFIGEIQQIPPMYSAVKINGKKLYEYARAGIEVERPARTVMIDDIQLLEGPVKHSVETLSFSFKVHCSKGTYVRTLAVDIGKALQYPAHMSALQRIASGPFKLKDCLSFEEIEQKTETNQLQAALLNIEDALSFLTCITVNEEEEFKVKNGAVLKMPDHITESRFTIFNKEGKCIAIYEQHPTKLGLMKPEKVFN